MFWFHSQSAHRQAPGSAAGWDAPAAPASTLRRERPPPAPAALGHPLPAPPPASPANRLNQTSIWIRYTFRHLVPNQHSSSPACLICYTDVTTAVRISCGAYCSCSQANSYASSERNFRRKHISPSRRWTPAPTRLALASRTRGPAARPAPGPVQVLGVAVKGARRRAGATAAQGTREVQHVLCKLAQE